MTLPIPLFVIVWHQTLFSVHMISSFLTFNNSTAIYIHIYIHMSVWVCFVFASRMAFELIRVLCTSISAILILIHIWIYAVGIYDAFRKSVDCGVYTNMYQPGRQYLVTDSQFGLLVDGRSQYVFGIHEQYLLPRYKRPRHLLAHY